ncbi:hypothetical protein BJG93_34655 (plasmid) [Paraburkholderia sprentiae WSM5005]|uniref:Uncharacterized protein n=1 Tax=Paraburkholderia sprentiae WSM5005 TaxID=754502 RepID=A0ACA8AX06_9BURK|nr:hypothetical protein [Paraburkholderia sprentiae]APA90256.1 hypothetical protein BJG93_34655 [Paraburkholderia sprentiae WSM5005]
MCYGNPVEMLANVLPDPMPRNRLGHTPLDDFEHFCAYSGLVEPEVGSLGFAWAKCAYVDAWMLRYAVVPDDSGQ